ncbi:MAG: hypothetical protein HZC50_03070 [Nitrospirae bacterium]|nr:hypothetical protein [Nitrospirota bacterium]
MTGAARATWLGVVVLLAQGVAPLHAGEVVRVGVMDQQMVMRQDGSVSASASRVQS